VSNATAHTVFTTAGLMMHILAVYTPSQKTGHNSCSWYSAILIIFTAKYQALTDDYLSQILLIMFDFWMSYDT